MKTQAERQAVRDALAALAERSNGLLTPEAVVAEAVKRDSVLHGYFEWDTKKAAHEWRLNQARELIRTVRVVVTTEHTSVLTVGYVRDPECAPDEQGYVATASLIGDRERCRAALVSEFGRAAASLRRARELAVAFGMEGEIDALTDSVNTTRTKIEARVQERAAA